MGKSKISDISLKKLTYLVSLKSHEYCLMTDDSLSLLTNLTELSIASDDYLISDLSVSLLTNLTTLSINYNHLPNSRITDKSIMKLTQLVDLDLFINPYITDQAVMKLTNLTCLNLEGNDTISIDALKNLTNLETLYLQDSKVSSKEWEDLYQSFKR